MSAKVELPPDIISELNKLNDTSKINYLEDLAWNKRFDDPQNAIDYLNYADEILQKDFNAFFMSKNLNLIGVVYMHLNDYSTALSYYYKALEVAERYKVWEEIGYTLNNIGHIYIFKNDLERAYVFIQQSINHNKFYNIKSALGYSYKRMSELQLERAHYDSALFYAKQALNIRQEIRDSNAINHSIIGLAEILEFKGDLNNAIEYYLKVTNFKPKRERTLFNLARTYYKLKKYDSSFYYVNQSYNIATKINNYVIAFEASVLLSQLYEVNHDFNQSNFYLKQSLNFKDSIENKEKERNIIQLTVLHKTNEKIKENEKLKQNEKSIKMILLFALVLILLLFALIFIILVNRKKHKENNKLLELKNKEIELQTERLAELNKTKDRFFSILAHDLKNPLGTFKQISIQLKEDFDHFRDNEKLEILETMIQSTSGIYNLLESLLEWSKTQRDQVLFNPTIVNYNFIIANIIDAFNPIANKKEITLISEIEDELTNMADVNMIATILRNLVSNAIKFSKIGGKIKIKANYSENGKVLIQIIDNGIGMPISKIQNLFKIDVNVTSPGTNNELGTGLGLILCKEFVEKHDGKIWVDSKENEGTTFSVLL